MSRLAITVLGAVPAAQTAAPGISFRLRVENISAEPMHAAVLRCQARLDAAGRRVLAEEKTRLYELFGGASDWSRNLHAVSWGNAAIVLPSFDRFVEVDLIIPCTYDLEVGACKYLHGLRDGHVMVQFFFTGTLFVHAAGGLHIEPVPWDTDAAFRMPAAIWHETMAQFFPGGGWLRVSRETLDRLQHFRGRLAVVSWDEAIDVLLKDAAKEEIA